MQKHRVSWSILTAYSSLAFPLAAAFLILQVIIPTYYAQVTGMSLSVIGVVLLVARLWDTFTDPLVGYLSDKTPQHWGRRKIWVLISAPFICLSCLALFNPPVDAGAWYLLFWTLAIYVTGTMAIIPMNAWGAELSPDYNERSRISGARVLLGLTGTLTALIVVAIYGDAGSSGENAAMQNTLYILTILVVVALVVSTLLAAFFVPDNNTVHIPSASFTSALQLLKTPSPFRTLIISFLINGIGSAIPATLFLLYVTHVLGIADKAGLFLFVYFICAAASIPIWIALAKRKGKHQVWSGAMIMGCLFFISAPFLGQQDFTWFLILVIGTGIAAGADLSLPSAINGDLIEWDAERNGHKRPGIFFALWGTTSKLAYALAIGITFPLLELLGFSANVAELADAANTPAAIKSLAWIYGLPCVLCKLFAVYLMYNYPITQDVHNEIRRKLHAKQLAD